MRILDEPITIDELRSVAAASFGDLVKAVVDVRRGLIALDGELHSDLEALLIRGVEDAAVRREISEIVARWVKK